ncbi:MAG: methyltransferase domain-containing protein [Acidimicrobiales bacterium]|jgi:TDG/mug DNA glycosylase family protein
MEEPTVAIYDDRGLAWAASHRTPGQGSLAEAFAGRVERAGPRLDVGCGAGRYTGLLGSPVIGLDASRSMLAACRALVPDGHYVLGDVEALPFARGSLAGAWSWMTHLHVPKLRLPSALWDLHRVLAVGAPFELQVLAGTYEGDALDGDDVGGRFFAGWEPAPLVDVVTGAGFEVEPDSVEVSGDELRLRAVRARTLADTVGPGMRLLVCGLNPSLFAADAGVGFARPGNRFWKAALAAGVVTRERDPLHALRTDGIGMTDQVKRATRAADELTVGEYRAGLGRLTRLVEWLEPGAVCFVGLAGWRAATGRKATAGRQEALLGGRPVYVMPSTSGLNARTSLTELTDHLREAVAEAEGGSAARSARRGRTR